MCVAGQWCRQLGSLAGWCSGSIGATSILRQSRTWQQGLGRPGQCDTPDTSTPISIIRPHRSVTPTPHYQVTLLYSLGHLHVEDAQSSPLRPRPSPTSQATKSPYRPYWSVVHTPTWPTHPHLPATHTPTLFGHRNARIAKPVIQRNVQLKTLTVAVILM